MTEIVNFNSTDLSEDDEIIEKKKIKLSSELIKKEMLLIRKRIESLDLELENHINELAIKTKQIKKKKIKFNREFSNLDKKLESVLEKEKIKAVKEKSKRKGPNNGGFNKKNIVPKPFRTYLNISKDELKTRPELVHLFSVKIRSDGFRDGKNIILRNKKIAKLFGKKKDYIIEFNKLQSFVKEIYDKEKKQINEVQI